MPYVPIEQVLDGVKAQTKGEINVCLPAKVLSYDEGTGKATVEVAVRTFYIDEDEQARAVKIPPISRAPVAFFQTGTFTMHAPLEAGDNVTLVVADRSIDEFMATGNADNIARDARRFDWTDAIVFPMPPSPTVISSLSSTDFFIGLKDGSAGITYTPDGTTKIEAGGHELITVLKAVLNVMKTGTTGTGAPTFNPATVTLIEAEIAKLTAMQA